MHNQARGDSTRGRRPEIESRKLQSVGAEQQKGGGGRRGVVQQCNRGLTGDGECAASAARTRNSVQSALQMSKKRPRPAPAAPTPPSAAAQPAPAHPSSAAPACFVVLCICSFLYVLLLLCRAQAEQEEECGVAEEGEVGRGGETGE